MIFPNRVGIGNASSPIRPTSSRRIAASSNSSARVWAASHLLDQSGREVLVIPIVDETLIRSLLNPSVGIEQFFRRNFISDQNIQEPALERASQRR